MHECSTGEQGTCLSSIPRCGSGRKSPVLLLLLLLLLPSDALEGQPPFSAIHVGAAAETVPTELLEALAPGGRMIIPVGPQWTGQVRGGESWRMEWTGLWRRTGEVGGGRCSGCGVGGVEQEPRLRRGELSMNGVGTPISEWGVTVTACHHYTRLPLKCFTTTYPLCVTPLPSLPYFPASGSP